VPDGVTSGVAAARLRTSKPTVHALIARGILEATKEPRGTRFTWRIDEDSLNSFLAENGPYEGRRKRRGSLTGNMEAELSTWHALLHRANGGTGAPSDTDSTGRERDDLRARVVSLEEALSRSQVAAELQRGADEERATVVQHLLLAAAAAERADALRRQALAQMQEAVAGFSRAGHPGQMV
jgi:hypothetical protein